ncbi:RNA polymerase sigma factor [Paenibacillus glufosinatiresistens]|uniref:RNA polymerase sigma factor n=1 Tax=Paenibacillus glufosinatiresistens TaxID=3070657 RepID=UPI00286D99F7|nr:sigma-70 family RNA polymerase sigma factor [Paenibacillus sp. YX.27]
MATRGNPGTGSDLELEQLIRFVQEGEVQPFEPIIRKFQKPIYLYCFYLLKNSQEAEDAAQDIFIKAIRHIKTYTPTVSFSAWIYKIAHNHCTDILKRKSRESYFFSRYRTEHLSSEAPHHYSEYIVQLLELLTMQERQILLLRALEEYNYEEIGSIMGIKAATVRKKYERIRKKVLKRRGYDRYEVYADAKR